MNKKKAVNTKKLFFALYIVFAVITLGSAAYTIVTRGNAGLALVAMLFALVFSNLSRRN